jgi:transcriptional regulator with XRE-family HTH domain
MYAKMITPTRRSQYGVFTWEHTVPTITPLQVKLARTAVRLGVRELAQEAGVAPSTIQRFESGRGDMQSRTLDKVQQALEGAGVIFIPADAAGGPGVRMKA